MVAIEAPARQGMLTGTLGALLPALSALPELQPDRRTWRLVFSNHTAALVASRLIRERVQAEAFAHYALREEECYAAA